MIITDLIHLSLCADDFILLDRIATAAGKSRDVFVSDVVFEMLTMERMILGEGSRRERTSGGANTNR